jgi:hypothetical protein
MKGQLKMKGQLIRGSWLRRYNMDIDALAQLPAFGAGIRSAQ